MRRSRSRSSSYSYSSYSYSTSRSGSRSPPPPRRDRRGERDVPPRRDRLPPPRRPLRSRSPSMRGGRRDGWRGNWLCEDVPDPRVVFIQFIDHIRFANQMHRFERFLKYTIAHATDPRRFPNPPRVIAMVPGSVSWNDWMEYEPALAERKRREGREPRWDSMCPSGRDAGALEGDALSLLANDLVPTNRNFCVPKNRATGEFRGMAYVTFRTPELAQRFLSSVAYDSGLQVLTGVDQPPGGILRAKAVLSRSTKATSAEMAARAAGHKRGREFTELSSGAPVAPSGASKSAHQAREAARLQHVASSKSTKRGRY